MSTVIPLVEAKARLSSMIQDVKGIGTEYVATVRGVPFAMVVPVPKPAPEHPRAKGVLAGRKPTGPRPSSGRAPPPPRSSFRSASSSYRAGSTASAGMRSPMR